MHVLPSQPGVQNKIGPINIIPINFNTCKKTMSSLCYVAYMDNISRPIIVRGIILADSSWVEIWVYKLVGRER